MDYVLIVGAKSDIATSVAEIYAKNGYNLYLAARKSSDLTLFANDLSIRTSTEVVCVDIDVLDYDSHDGFYKSLNGTLAGVIFVAGYLGDQNKAQSDFSEARKIIETNYVGAISLLGIIAEDFERQQSGFIVGIGSVAGDRGRASNYIYGSSKAAFSTFLSGLRNRLHNSGVHVLSVKPGFVDTKMTQGMDLPSRLTSSPQEIAKDIYKAQQNKKNTLYTKSVWGWIMFVIRLIPERIFKKMSL